jgi:class 3 adenylate cyclase
MWHLTIRSPENEPVEYPLKPGKYIIGRMAENDIVIDDISASRHHAELTIDAVSETITIRDVNSTNGTYVNRQRIEKPVKLQSNDIIRIGQAIINLAWFDTGKPVRKDLAVTHHFTRELILESLDQHSFLLYEVARHLNTVLDIETALLEVSNLIKRSMGANRCMVILAKQFNQLNEMGFPEVIAKEAIRQQAAVIFPDMMSAANQEVRDAAIAHQIHSAMCVPVMSNEEILGLIYMYRNETNLRPFDQRDMQLAVAISHQTALTIQRMYLIERLRKEQQAQQLLLRFLSPQEAEFLLQDYLESGSLPGLSAQKVSILFADIADSTGMAERLGPQHFATILDLFYRDSMEIMFKYGGVVKLMGDGIMAVFGVKASNKLHEEQAICAGSDLINRVRTADYPNLDTPVVIGVAINTGMAMVGYVGTQERAEFTVLGDTVNVAYRMQEFARPYRLVIGPGTIAAVSGKFNTQRIGGVTIRGREKSMQIYEVLM